MNRHELYLLQQISGYPALTITLPTHRSSTDNRQDADVWRVANEGRGSLLLVEKDYHAPATTDEAGWHLLPADEAAAPDGMDDAVDEIIETVLSKQGRVVFLENGQLETHQRIALNLR